MEFPISDASESRESPETRRDAPVSLDMDTKNFVVPVIREDWHLSKEVRQTGTVRIRKSVQEREELIEDSLLSDAVEVERRPMDKVVETAPEVRNEDGATVYSVVREFLVVTKQLRVVEEIWISRRKSEIPFQQRVMLRSEEVLVDRIATGVAVTGSEIPNEAIEFTETREEAIVTKAAQVVEEVTVSKEVTTHFETVNDTVRHTEVEVEKLEPDAVKTSTTWGK